MRLGLIGQVRRRWVPRGFRLVQELQFEYRWEYLNLTVNPLSGELLRDWSVNMMATEWGTREQIMHHYELVARYVMPRFQGSVDSLISSQKWSAEIKEELGERRAAAMERARHDYESQDSPQG